jgi:predicted pyridoxine 5'-phosphate oxidase superfamily flavin-nucleotide-binding protein
MNRDKVLGVLEDVHRVWIAATTLLFVATSSADGRCDVSPKGDPAGLVHLLGASRLVIPERPESFFHCPKAFRRSGTWNPEAWRSTACTPHTEGTPPSELIMIDDAGLNYGLQPCFVRFPYRFGSHRVRSGSARHACPMPRISAG